MTPLSNKIARPLAEGLKNEVVCREDRITRIIPQKLLDVREAIHSALSQVESHLVETSWTMAGPMPGDPDWSGGTVFRDEREVAWTAPPRGPCSGPCVAWAASVGGMQTGSGRFEAGWIDWQAVQDCAAVGGIPIRSGMATPWISGEWWGWTRIAPFPYARRCVCLAKRCSISGLERMGSRIAPCGKPPSSSHGVCSD